MNDTVAVSYLDIFPSKLFAKKVEKLFDVTDGMPGSPENASTLFRHVSFRRNNFKHFVSIMFAQFNDIGINCRTSKEDKIGRNFLKLLNIKIGLELI